MQEGFKESSKYLKVSDYNVSGNCQNFRLFYRQLRQTPTKTFLLSLAFFLLGIFILIMPHSESLKFTTEWSVMIPVAISLIMAVWLFVVGIVAIFRK